MKVQEKRHSVLGASSAVRWLACPGSVRSSLAVPPQATSEYAVEGTAAHHLAELCFQRQEYAQLYLGRLISVGDYSIEVGEELAEAVQLYLDFLRAESDGAPKTALECEVNLDWLVQPDLSWARLPPGLDANLSGTADAVIVKGFGDRLLVADYKHGSGIVVEPDENPQMLFYGLGALGPDNRYDVDEVELAIVQPRAFHEGGKVRRWLTTPAHLYDWAQTVLKPGIVAASRPDAPLVAGEDQCRWCAARGQCPEAYARNVAVVQRAFADQKLQPQLPEPATLTPEQVRLIVDRYDEFKSWLDAVWDYALGLAKTAGLPGFKVVAGRRTRAWREADAVKVLGILKQHLKTDAYAPPKMLTVAQATKALAALKKEGVDIKLLSDYIETKETTTLVPDADSRPGLSPTEVAQTKADKMFANPTTEKP